MALSRLSNDSLWARMKSLEGRCVYTLKYRRPNPIHKVNDDRVVVEGRKSVIPRSQVEDAYNALWQDGRLEIGAHQWSGGASYLWYLVPALLLEALPDQVEKLPPGSLSGIRVRK